MGMAARIIEANRRLSRRLYQHFPQFADNRVWELYPRRVAELASRPGQGLAVDLGGGRACRYAALIAPGGAKVIAADISPDELAHNQDVAGKLACDATRPLPLADNSVDIIASQSVLEHLADNAAFFTEAHRVLKPGGCFAHMFPSSLAPFVLLNRALPARVSRWALDRLVGNSDELGFKHYYDRCRAGAMAKLLGQTGFRLEDMHLSYCQSEYFTFCLPLFLLSAGYEYLVRALGIKSLAAYVFFVAVKD